MTVRLPGAEPRSMLWFAKDAPNLLSLVGLACALLGIYFAILGVFPAAMIGLVWAVVFDWLDGIVARGMQGRTDEQREFGGHLDSLIDVVSFAVAPAVLLISVGSYRPWLLLPASLVLAAGVIRLAYFNTFGLVEGSTYRGLALDNNILVVAALFAAKPLFVSSSFTATLCVVLLVMAALNIAPIHTPKPSGSWCAAVIGYAVVLSVLFGWQLLAGM